MNKDVIKAKLNQNRQKLLLKDTQPKINILAAIKVAKDSSEHFHESVCIIEKQGKYYFKEYTGKLPTTTFHSFLLSEKEANIVISVINDYLQHKHYHTNPYSWLICGCFYNGFDLIKEGVMEL